MDNFQLVGIQQIGIGTEDMVASWKWYADMFQMNVRILEDDTVAERMLPYTNNKPEKRHACIAANLQGGGGFEIWQYSERKPLPIDFDVQIGDLGIFCVKIKSHDIAAYHAELAAKYKNITQIQTEPNGMPTFYVRDPNGNLFQVVEDKYMFIDEKRYSGGVVGAMIGVTDIDKALTVYRDILGYDTVVYDKNGAFSDWQTLRGGGQRYRRVLLTRSQPFAGPFQNLYGEIMLNENMKHYEAKKQELDDMMNYLIGILSQCVNGADPATCEPVSADGECTGSCSTCGGCG